MCLTAYMCSSGVDIRSMIAFRACTSYKFESPRIQFIMRESFTFTIVQGYAGQTGVSQPLDAAPILDRMNMEHDAPAQSTTTSENVTEEMKTDSESETTVTIQNIIQDAENDHR